MNKVVIHIGYHKTASTYLQTEVFPKLPVNYLFFAGEDRWILEMLQSSNTPDKAKVFAWIQQQVTAKYGHSRHPVTVLSHEALSGHPHGYPVISQVTIAKNLKTIFPDAVILIVVRNQYDYLLSTYTYRVAVKGYENRAFSKFLEEEGTKGLFEHLEYERLVALYQDLFGKDSVTVVPMELLRSDPVQFQQMLFRLLDTLPQEINSRSRVNESTRSLTIISFWRVINSLFMSLHQFITAVLGKSAADKMRFKYYDLKRAITSHLNKILRGSRQIDITRQLAAFGLEDRYEASNQRLRSLTNLDLSALGYPIRDTLQTKNTN